MFAHVYQCTMKKSHYKKWDLNFPSLQVSSFKFLSYQVTKLPNYQVTKLPNYQVTKLPSYQVTQLPSYQVTKLPVYQVQIHHYQRDWPTDEGLQTKFHPMAHTDTDTDITV